MRITNDGAMSGDELVLPLQIHQRNLWLVLEVPVAGRRSLTLVVDSGCAISAMKQVALDHLMALGSASRVSATRFLVQQLVVASVGLPDMVVRAGGPADRVDADGIIGLDYLYQFQRVCVDTRTLQLTLTLP